MKKISICIPCFNEEGNINHLYKELLDITKKYKKYDFEYILVDNGSTDKTKQLIKVLAKKNKKVIGIFLSRNFGPEASGQAAFNYATGDAIIGISADLQDPPELIPQFIKKWENGYDIVLGRYIKAKGNFLMNWIRKSFYKVFKTMTNIDMPMNVTGFGLIDRKVNNIYRSLPEKYRFGRGLIAWLGFKKSYIPFKKQPRFKGVSSYSFIDYIKGAERGIFGFSYLPLDIMVYAGFILVLISFLFILVYLILVLFFGNPIKAQIPIMLAIVFFGSIQLLAVSIIGKYIQVIVEETKARPTYVVAETVNTK